MTTGRTLTPSMWLRHANGHSLITARTAEAIVRMILADESGQAEADRNEPLSVRDDGDAWLVTSSIVGDEDVQIGRGSGVPGARCASALTSPWVHTFAEPGSPFQSEVAQCTPDRALSGGPKMRYDFNVLERRAEELLKSGEIRSALRIYYFMADGDPSLDGGYLGVRIGHCYEALGERYAAKYWYNRALEEDPSRDSLHASINKLGDVSLNDLVAPELYTIP